MNILSYNSGHDGVIVFMKDGRLLISKEAENDSNWRYSPLSIRDVFAALGESEEFPDVVCSRGWWPRDHHDYLHGSQIQYRGVSKKDAILTSGQLLGRPVHYFSDTHER